jgi:hypothetical protein
MSARHHPLFVLLVALTESSLSAKAACIAQTTVSATHVVELYTSEGCSSCPPAERWLDALTDADPSVRALEFHVDYWDSLGWTDIYASARYTERQQQLASLHASSGVYTPEVLADGREWRDWYRGATLRKAPAPALPLTLAITDATPLQAQLTTTAGTPAERYRWFLAVTENNLVRAIGKGENRGSTMRHAHVVRAFIGPLRMGGDPVTVDMPSATNLANADLVALVVNTADATSVQAIAWPLASCAR